MNKYKSAINKLGSIEQSLHPANKMNIKKKNRDNKLPEYDKDLLIKINNLWKNKIEFVYVKKYIDKIVDIISKIKLRKQRPAFTLFKMNTIRSKDFHNTSDEDNDIYTDINHNNDYIKLKRKNIEGNLEK